MISREPIDGVCKPDGKLRAEDIYTANCGGMDAQNQIGAVCHGIEDNLNRTLKKYAVEHDSRDILFRPLERDEVKCMSLPV